MGLITAVPFGLAIKDTITGKAPLRPAAHEEEVDESLASYERAQRDYEQRQEKETAELEAALGALLPSGTIEVRGYDVNQAAPQDVGGIAGGGVQRAELKRRLERVAHATFTPTRRPDGTLKNLTISFPEYKGELGVCQAVSEHIQEGWGGGAQTYDNGTRIHFASTTPQHHRITFVELPESSRCELVLEEYIDAAAFITKTEASAVPVWAIGKPAAKLVEKLGGDAFSDTTQIRWSRPGVGKGLGETELYARVVKGKIVTITARFQASSVSLGEVAEQLVTDHGAPIDGDPVVWPKAKLSIATEDDSAGTYLFVAGAPLPADDTAADDE